MKSLKASKSVVVAVALAACFLLNCNRAGAVIVNVLLDVPWTSNPNFTNISGAANANPLLTYTDGTTATWDYDIGAITYDLGGITPGIETVGVATNGAAGARGNPRFITLNFSDDNFTTTLATDVVPLADQMTDQQVAIPTVAARYVEFVFPSSPGLTDFYDDGFGGSDGFVLPAELELDALVPEPASLCLLGVGSLLILRRRRFGGRCG